MMNFLHAAGLVVWPLLLLAAVTLWFSVRYLLTARSRHLLVASSCAVFSLLVALLSVVVGYQLSIWLAPAAGPQPVFVLISLSESLNAVVLALFTCLLATLLLSIGRYRLLRSPGSREEHRPGETLARA